MPFVKFNFERNPMLKKTLIGLIVTFICATLALAQSQSKKDEESDFYNNRALNDPERPYLYYPDAEKPKNVNEDQAKLPQTGEEAMKAMEALQQSVKLSRALALMNPTPEHLKDYIAKQEVVMNTSAKFTDVWRRAIWQNPELDYSLKHRPTNNAAIQVYDAQRNQKTKEVMANIAASQGLVFFMRGDCSYCHAMAPILKQFQDTYGIRIMAVSLDGGTVPGFENSTVPDNGISARLGVSQTPTLFLADTRNKRYLPIGSGMMSISELETRFVALINEEPGTSF